MMSVVVDAVVVMVHLFSLHAFCYCSVSVLFR